MVFGALFAFDFDFGRIRDEQTMQADCNDATPMLEIEYSSDGVVSRGERYLTVRVVEQMLTNTSMAHVMRVAGV